jgi:hypothetical protein
VIAKPSRTAWALNQVARREPALVQAALEALADAQAAQGSPDGVAMRATARAYRERVTAVTDAAAEFVREAGSELPPLQLRRIGATMQAVAAGGDADLREQLVKGRLAADVNLDDPFGGVTLKAQVEGVTRARASHPAAVAKHAASGKAAPDRAASDKAEAVARARAEAEARERARRADQLEKARARVEAMEVEAKQARSAARDAEVAATRAQAEAERARRAVEPIEKRLEEARRSLRAMKS